MKILLLEPDTVLSRIYKKYLNEKKFEVIECNDSEMTLVELEKKLPDLIILELQIADHNGVELLHELRSYEDWAKIPIIINSLIPKNIIQISNKIMKQFLILDYLYKPSTSLDDLNASIQKVSLASI